MKLLMCIWHQHQSKNQVLGNHCVYSPTYLMLKIKQKNVVLELKNQNSDPWKWVIYCGPRKKQKGHSKTKEQIKRNVYAWITRHPQVVQSPIYNYCLKVMFDDQTEPQLVPNFLLQVSVREIKRNVYAWITRHPQVVQSPIYNYCLKVMFDGPT